MIGGEKINLEELGLFGKEQTYLKIINTNLFE